MSNTNESEHRALELQSKYAFQMIAM